MKKELMAQHQPCELVQTLSQTKKVFKKCPPGNFQGPPRYDRGCLFRYPPPYPFAIDNELHPVP